MTPLQRGLATTDERALWRIEIQRVEDVLTIHLTHLKQQLARLEQRVAQLEKQLEDR